MRTFKLRVREIHEVEFLVKVPDRFTPYPEDELDGWANEIAENDAEPIETFDVQIERVIAAEEVASN